MVEQHLKPYHSYYSSSPAMVIGFHGCNREIANKAINGEIDLSPSTNDYDWLGNGIYFWEANPSRAEIWAKEQYKKDWSVIGAYIDLGLCLNLLDNNCLKELKLSFVAFKKLCTVSGREMPQNTGKKGSMDLLNRKLDCAIIQSLHTFRQFQNKPSYDTVRGVFWEGNELYKNAGFKEKNHIQIAVVNPRSILGYFKPKLEI